MNKIWTYIAQIAIVIAVALLSWWISRLTYKIEPVTIFEQLHDTLVVEHTNVVYEPKIVEKRVLDTIFVPITERDTVYGTMALPRESVMYQDSTYRAVVSGYRPSLDSIMIRNNTVYITTTEVTVQKVRREWAFGIQAGVGAVSPFSEFKPQLGYYIGLGISKSF